MNKAHVVALLGILVSAGPVMAEHEHEDIIVGRTSGGQLMVHFDFGHEIALAPVSGLVNGWAGDHPGFGHLEEAEPAEDFYTLGAGASIYLEVVSFDPAFQIWGPGLTGPFSAAGEQVLLGDDYLHEHVTFHINSDDPAFAMSNSPWEATFRLVDLGTTGYSASAPFTATFVPEPMTSLLLALGAATAWRRRR